MVSGSASVRNLEEVKDLSEEAHSIDVDQSYGIIALSFNNLTNRNNPDPRNGFVYNNEQSAGL